MRRQTLLLLAAAVLLLGALGVWWLRDGPRDDSPRAAPVLGRAAGRNTDAPDLDANLARAPGAATVVPLETSAALPESPSLPPAATAASPAEAAVTGDEAVFTGRVVDDAGAPIAGATVVYWPTEASWKLYGLQWDAWGEALDVLPRALTNAAGRFELRGRHLPGKGITGRDDEPALAVLFADHAIRSRSFEKFSPGVVCDAGDIALEPGAPLTGRIVDESGRAIAGAVIKPWNPRARSLRGTVDALTEGDFSRLTLNFATTASGADGRFRTGALWHGSTQLAINAAGYRELWRDKLDVEAGHPNDLGDVVLVRGNALAGRVRDADGAPVAGARVLAWDSGNSGGSDRLAAEHDMLLRQLAERSKAAFVLTDADGRFALPGLEHANHCVLVDAAGFEPLRVNDVLPGAADLDVKLVGAATLQLTIVDAVTQQPVSGASVLARRMSGWKGDTLGVELPVTAGAAPGSFVVTRAGLRLTALLVEAPGYATTSVAVDGLTPPACASRSVELPREARVSGLVTGADGTPLAEATVRARPPRDDAWWRKELEVTTDAQGRYAFVALSAGEWKLRAFGRDHGPVERTLELAGSEPLAGVDFALPAAAGLFGVCFTEDGTRAVREKRTLFWIDPEGRKNAEPAREATTDEQGRYEFRDLRPGTWRFAGKSGIEVTLAPGERLELDLYAPLRAKIEGRVLQADGTPVPDAWVFIHSPRMRGEVPSIERADAEGRYTWTHGWTGRIEIVAAAPDGGGMSAPLVFELLEGEQRIADLRLGGQSVTGRVLRDEDGSPVAGARVRLIALLEDDMPAAWGAFNMNDVPVDFGAVSDAAGRFEVRHLPPGRFGVTVSASDAMSATPPPPLVLVAGAAPELELRVTATGAIAGSARLASGVPVKDRTRVHAESAGQEQSASVAGGRFELKDLLPGSWLVQLRDGETILAQQVVTVTARVVADVELIAP